MKRLAFSVLLLGGCGAAADKPVQSAPTAEPFVLAPVPDAGAPEGPPATGAVSELELAAAKNVELAISFTALAAHPVGARLVPLLFTMPAWSAFAQTAVAGWHPAQFDWLLVYGPSLIRTDRNAVVARYRTADATIDLGLERLAQKYGDGEPFEAGGRRLVPLHLDNGARVAFRTPTRRLVVLPKGTEPSRFAAFDAADPELGPSAAVRLVVQHPERQIATRNLRVPAAVETLAFTLDLAADGSGVGRLEASIERDGSCDDVAKELDAIVQQANTGLVRASSRGLLNGVAFACEGQVAKARIPASKQQLERIVQLMALALGVQAP